MAARHASSRLFWRLVAPLLLLVISVHAVTPLGQPLQRVAGSAFSAETVDVSLRSGQRSAVVKQAEVPKPPAAILPSIVPLPVIAPAHEPPAMVPGLGATGPPPTARTSFRPVSPRAPPAA